MRKQNRLLLLFVMLCVLLCACAAPEADVPETAAPTAAPTEAPTEPVETEPRTPEAVMPETDAATGTLKFYFGEHEIHAGAPMAELIGMGIYTEQDLDQIIQPLHTSEVITVRVDLEDKSFDDDPMLFVVAINGSEEPQTVSRCQIYSITVNTDKGICFGSGNETEPFVTGTTTREQLVAAYGEPPYAKSGDSKYEEIAYYQNFNSAYFSFKDGKVRQVLTCYSANIFGDRAEGFTYDLGGAYFGSDCAILMNQYLDVTPYLDGTAAVEKLEELEASIVMADQTIEFGVRAAKMPTPFGEPFVDLLMPLSRNYYIRTGRNVEEEFYLYNLDGQKDNLANDLVVKGAITENRNYVNWGIDNSGFHTFEYMGLTNEATIADALEIFGAPMKINFNSNGRVCYAWLSYEDVNGNTMLLRVDPMLDQIVEIRVSRYYSGERYYD